MRKHFLILMLLSLLPMVGWAQTATLGEVALGKYTYGGADYPTPVVKDSEGAILTVTTHYTVSGDAYTDEACTKAVAGKADLKADGTKYYLKITGAGAYVGQSKAVWFTVDKAKLTISYEANALDRAYGADPVALVESKFDKAGAVGYVWGQDDKVLKGSMPTGYTTANNNAGVDKAVTFIGGWTADNYEIAYSATLTISAKPLVAGDITFTAQQGDVVYTGNDITGTYGIKVGTTVLTQGTKGKGGDYWVATVHDVSKNNAPLITFQGNYSGTVSPTETFDVTPAPITVSINDIEVMYNNANQRDQLANAVFNYSGIVGGDVATAATIKAGFTAPTSVNVGSDVYDAGEYSLTISGGAAGGNYEFKTYIPGNLTVSPAELAIIAGNKVKNLGDADPANSFTVKVPGNLVAGDVIEGIAYTREEGEDVGTYNITPVLTAAKVKRGKNYVTSNYKFTVGTPKGTLTITKGAIVVTIKDAEKFYGQEDPEFEYIVTGLQDGDELAAFTINRDKKGAKGGENVGPYALTATVTNPNPEKYTSLTVIPGILTINKALLTFTMPAQNVVTGDKKNALKKDVINVTGINNSDDAATLFDLDFNGVTLDAGAITAENKTYATGYKATLTDAADDNYLIITDPKTNPVTTGVTINGKLIVNDGTAAALAFTSINTDYTEDIVPHAGETQNVTLTIAPRNIREVPAGTVHKWAAKTWNTMVLPFEVSVRDLSYALGYAIVNVVDPNKTTENNVQFKLEMDKIPANTPFCVKTDKAIGDAYVITFPNPVTIVAPANEYPSVDAGMGYKFVGAYKAMTINKDKSTLKFLRGDAAKWANIGATSSNTWQVVPFDAYIDLSAAAAPEQVTFTFEEIDGSTTTIKAVEAGSKDDNMIYNIAGQKVNAAYKGLVIKNGKKYFQK